MRDFRKLHVYQFALDLVVDVYRFTELLPGHERFGISSQLRRAAVNITSNIAEGTRGSNKEFAQFIRIALGSANEIESQLEVCSRLYEQCQNSKLISDIRLLQAKLGALHKSIRLT